MAEIKLLANSINVERTSILDPRSTLCSPFPLCRRQITVKVYLHVLIIACGWLGFQCDSRIEQQESKQAKNLLQLIHSPPLAIGMLRNRVPVALKMALLTAGANPMIPISPAPAEGMSLRSIRTTSI